NERLQPGAVAVTPSPLVSYGKPGPPVIPRGSAEGGTQLGQAFGDRRPPVLFSLELQRDVAAVVVSAEHRGDPRVVQFERVPDPAAAVGLSLHKNGLRRHLLQAVV